MDKRVAENIPSMGALVSGGIGLLFSILAIAAVLTLIADPSLTGLLYASTAIAVTVWFFWLIRLLRRYGIMNGVSRSAIVTTGEAVEHERIITLMNNLSDSVLSIDVDGTVVLYNAACLSLLDTNKSLDGLKLNDLFNVEDETGKPVHLFTRVKKARGVTVDDTLRIKQGDDTIRLEFTYAPIRGSFKPDSSATKDGYMIIVRDITRLKSLEEERDEFISVVSHELRTPVTVAEGTISNVQLMIERGKDDKAMIDKSLEEAHNQILYLARMINDLSTLSRAERGVAAEAELINVESMAHELYAEYAPEAEKQGLHLNLDLGHDLGSVMTSRLYLHELLQNFITNGIKYTKEGTVTLSIKVVGDDITFTVSDTGIGISRADQAKVFEKFFRSEDYRTRETGGTGLGLYVAAKLSRKIHTTIEVKSRLNHGSSFSFTLPKTHKSK